MSEEEKQIKGLLCNKCNSNYLAIAQDDNFEINDKIYSAFIITCHNCGYQCYID